MKFKERIEWPNIKILEAIMSEVWSCIKMDINQVELLKEFQNKDCYRNWWLFKP